jgi:hypothetical protein
LNGFLVVLVVQVQVDRGAYRFYILLSFEIIVNYRQSVLVCNQQFHHWLPRVERLALYEQICHELFVEKSVVRMRFDRFVRFIDKPLIIGKSSSLADERMKNVYSLVCQINVGQQFAVKLIRFQVIVAFVVDIQNVVK